MLESITRWEGAGAVGNCLYGVFCEKKKVKVRKRSLGLDNAKNCSELQGTGGVPGCQVLGPGVIMEMYN